MASNLPLHFWFGHAQMLDFYVGFCDNIKPRLTLNSSEDDLESSLSTFLIRGVDHHTQLDSRFCCSPACPRTVL